MNIAKTIKRSGAQGTHRAGPARPAGAKWLARAGRKGKAAPLVASSAAQAAKLGRQARRLGKWV